MAESRGIDIIRISDTSILLIASLFDASDNKITAGVTSIRLSHFVPGTGALEGYDFNDNTFKTTALTTATISATHRTTDNSTHNTGIWTYRHSTLTNFVKGDKYLVEVEHASLPRPVLYYFQYGDVDGDQLIDISSAVWDVDIEAAHGTDATAGLLLRALGAAISNRSNNATLDSLLGAPDVAGAKAGVAWIGGAADAGSDASNIVDAARTEAVADYWAGAQVLMTSGANAGQIRRISAFNEGTDTITVATPFKSVVGVGDGYTILNFGSETTATVLPADVADAVWDEDIVGAHGGANAAGLLLRVLGAAIAGRANNATLGDMLGVPDSAGINLVDAIWDEVLDAAHAVAASAATKLKDIDALVAAGGSGDIAAIKTQVDKLDGAACTAPATADSVAYKIDNITNLATRAFIVAVNLNGTTMHIEVGMEQNGVILTTPTTCTCQIFNEAGGVVRLIDAGDFGAIGTRGFFTYDWADHTLLNGHTYQALVTITIAPSPPVQTTKVFKMLSTTVA